MTDQPSLFPSCPRCGDTKVIYSDVLDREVECPQCSATAPFRDPAEAEQKKQEAIKRVDEHADVEWKDLALRAVYIAAVNLTDLTSDDAWERLNGDAATHDPRAMGPVMKRAQSRGWIEPTSTFRPSARPVNHRRDQRVWRSLVHRA